MGQVRKNQGAREDRVGSAAFGYKTRAQIIPAGRTTNDALPQIHEGGAACVAARVVGRYQHGRIHEVHRENVGMILAAVWWAIRGIGPGAGHSYTTTTITPSTIQDGVRVIMPPIRGTVRAGDRCPSMVRRSTRS